MNYGFSDLHGFKDYIIFVSTCAPNRFPKRDHRPPEEQWTLDLAFAGLRYGLQLTAAEKGELPILAVCRQLVEEAYAFYREGRRREGFFKLEEVAKLLKAIPSQ